MIQNAAARLVFNEPKRTHVYTSLHLIALATSGSSHQVQDTDACIQNDHRLSTLLLPLTITIYIPSRSLRSASERRLVVPSQRAQNHSPEHSHSPVLDGGIIFPPLSGMLDPCQSSSNNWKLISFGTTWLHPKLVLKKKKKKTFPLSFSPSLASSYLFEQWLRLGVMSTSSVWLPLQDESLYVFPNCKSLWIKASAKWLNVNVNVLLFYCIFDQINTGLVS